MSSAINNIFMSAYYKTDSDSIHTEDMNKKKFSCTHTDSTFPPKAHNLFKEMIHINSSIQDTSAPNDTTNGKQSHNFTALKKELMNLLFLSIDSANST